METTQSPSSSKKNHNKSKKSKTQHESVSAGLADAVSKDSSLKNNEIKLESLPLGLTSVENLSENPVKDALAVEELTDEKHNLVCSCPSVSPLVEQPITQEHSENSAKRKKKKKKKKKKSSPDEAPNEQTDVSNAELEPSISSACSAPEESISNTDKTKKKKKKKKKSKTKSSSEKQEFSSVVDNTVGSGEVAQIVEAQISVHPDEEIVCDIHIGNSETHPLNFDVSVPSKNRQGILSRGPDCLPPLSPTPKHDNSLKQSPPQTESKPDLSQPAADAGKHDGIRDYYESPVRQDDIRSDAKLDVCVQRDLALIEGNIRQLTEELTKSNGNIHSPDRFAESEPQISGSPVKSSSLDSAKKVLDEVDSEISILVGTELLKQASQSILENIKRLDHPEKLQRTSALHRSASCDAKDTISDEICIGPDSQKTEDNSHFAKECEVLDSCHSAKTDLNKSPCDVGLLQGSCALEILEQPNEEFKVDEADKFFASPEIDASQSFRESDLNLNPSEIAASASVVCETLEELSKDKVIESSVHVANCADGPEILPQHTDDQVDTAGLTNSEAVLQSEELPANLPSLSSVVAVSSENFENKTDQLQKDSVIQLDSAHQDLVVKNVVNAPSELPLQNSPNLEKVGEPLSGTETATTDTSTTMPANEDKVEKNAAAGIQAKEQQADARKTKAQLKAERRAAFEAQKGQLLGSKENKSKEQKSKAELRAERRALQEAQRAAKAGTGVNIGKASTPTSDTGAVTKAPKTTKIIPDSPKVETTKSEDGSAVSPPPKEIGDPCADGICAPVDALKFREEQKVSTSKRRSPQRANMIQPFSHLPRGHWDKALTKDLGLSGSPIHPAIIKLGLQLSEGIIQGSDARCVALLLALKQVIKDYTTPSQKEIARDLEAKLKSNIKFLCGARPLSVSMTNAVKYLQWHVTSIPSGYTDSKAKEELTAAIDKFIREEIDLAKLAISNCAREKIKKGDVILTYGCSSLVCKVLCDAKEDTDFRVIVVDARPKLQAREMLRNLLKAGISCSYVYINAVSYVMQEVTKVILGAHSLQANGYVVSHVGSSQIALIAHAYNVPVLFCCETYKFSERAQTDSFVYNELGDPSEIVQSTPSHKQVLDDIEDTPSLHILNLVYDITPPDFVSVVITEKGMLPCTSVPAVLRVKSVVQDRG